MRKIKNFEKSFKNDSFIQQWTNVLFFRLKVVTTDLVRIFMSWGKDKTCTLLSELNSEDCYPITTLTPDLCTRSLWLSNPTTLVNSKGKGSVCVRLGTPGPNLNHRILNSCKEIPSFLNHFSSENYSTYGIQVWVGMD